MNKKILFPIMLLLASTFCFSQNENPTPEAQEPIESPEQINEPKATTTEIEESIPDESLEPIPTEESTIEMPNSMAPAPIVENEVRDFQLTLLTPIGTNGIESSKITNRLSVNVLAGVNGGLDGLEVGGIANVITGNADGFQGAGIANLIRGNFDGAQAAGIANFVRRDFEGIQATGITNLNLGKTKGVQAAGILNNAFKGFDGVQGAGLINMAGGKSKGIQVAGSLNFAKNLDGIQIGFINVADTLDGLAIGFFSYARNGYHVLEASTNETFQANLSFKTGGSKYFYNIFSTGIRFNNNNASDDYRWAFGYGIGSKFMLSKRLGINADIISYAILPRTINTDRDFEDQDFGAVGKLNLGFSYTVAKHFTVYGGPTLNILINQNDSFIDNINPREIFTATDDDVNVIVYPGFNVGIRI